MERLHYALKLTCLILIIFLFTKCANSTGPIKYAHSIDTLLYSGTGTCSVIQENFDTTYADSLFVLFYPDSLLFAFRYIDIKSIYEKEHAIKFLYPSAKFKLRADGIYNYHFGPLKNHTMEDLVFKVVNDNYIEFQQIDIEPSDVKMITTFKGNVNRSVKYSEVVKTAVHDTTNGRTHSKD